ncbi:hypothetical protein ACEPAF_934 [Sanghuangporus sanghuang]
MAATPVVEMRLLSAETLFDPLPWLLGTVLVAERDERSRYRLETDNFFGAVGSTRMTFKSNRFRVLHGGGELFWTLPRLAGAARSITLVPSVNSYLEPLRMKIMDEKLYDYFGRLGASSSPGSPLEIKGRILMSSLSDLKQSENHVCPITLSSVRLAYQESSPQFSANKQSVQAENDYRIIPVMFSDCNSLLTTAAGLSFPVSRLPNYNHARASPLVMGPEEMKVRQRLRTQCLPTRAPSPVGFSEDAPSDQLDESIYPFTFTYPPSLAHAILAGEDELKFDYEEELPLLVDTTPRFVSPRDVSAPSFSSEGTEQSAFSSPPTESATDTPDTEGGGENTENDCSYWESDDDENEGFCEEQWEQEETTSEASYSGQKRRRPAQDDEDEENEEFREFEENSDEANEDEDEDEDEEEENPEAVYAYQKRRRPVCKSRRSIQAESDNAIQNLVGEDTPLKTHNGRYICRWGIVVGGGCAETFTTAQSHDRHVTSHVPDVGGDVFKTFLCRFCLRDSESKPGSGRFNRQDPCKRHIVTMHLSKGGKHSWRGYMLVRKRPWWWPSPLFLTGSFNLGEEKLKKRPSGETRSWVAYLTDVVRRTGDTLADEQRDIASVDDNEDDSEPGPSRRRSKRARRS